MKTKVLVFLCVIALSFSKTPVITIDHGVMSKIPIALHRIISTDSEVADYMQEIIQKDLSKCGLINIIEEKSHMQKLLSLAETPKYGQWKSSGAHFLVVASLTLVDQKYVVELKVYDTVVGKILDYYKMSSSKNSLRSLAHSMSDKIYSRVTGEKGYFNSKIAFVNEQAGSAKRGISIMDMDGYNEVSVVSGNTKIFLSPRISPDGKKLVYFSYKQGKSRYRRGIKDIKGEVYIMDLKTAKIQPLHVFTTINMSYAPRFSPDSSNLVFSLSDDNGGSVICRYNINTSTLTRLTKSVARSIDTSPCYSPDGKKIVFNSDKSGTQQLYIMSASGGEAKRLSFGNGRYATPVWSPRGDFIAFSRITEGAFYIGLMRPDGSGERMIASGYMVENPTWIGNGRALLYTKMGQRQGHYSIRMVDVTGNHDVLIKDYASDPDVNVIN